MPQVRLRVAADGLHRAFSLRDIRQTPQRLSRHHHRGQCNRHVDTSPSCWSVNLIMLFQACGVGSSLSTAPCCEYGFGAAPGTVQISLNSLWTWKRVRIKLTHSLECCGLSFEPIALCVNVTRVGRSDRCATYHSTSYIREIIRWIGWQAWGRPTSTSSRISSSTPAFRSPP